MWASSMTGAVEVRRELHVLAVAIVDPDLDDVDFLRRQLLHGLASLGRPRNPVRRHRPSRFRRREARPAVKNRAAPGMGIDRMANAAASVSCPMLMAALTP